VYEALSYSCTSLKLLVHAALSCWCMWPKPLVYVPFFTHKVFVWYSALGQEVWSGVWLGMYDAQQRDGNSASSKDAVCLRLRSRLRFRLMLRFSSRLRLRV
jgi:hypothetical protein